MTSACSEGHSPHTHCSAQAATHRHETPNMPSCATFLSYPSASLCLRKPCLPPMAHLNSSRPSPPGSLPWVPHSMLTFCSRFCCAGIWQCVKGTCPHHQTRAHQTRRRNLRLRGPSLPSSTVATGPNDSFLHSQLPHPQALKGQLPTDGELELNKFLLMCCLPSQI